MNKIERVEASLAGKEFDRPPVSFWYHFGTQHSGGEVIAELELEFLRHYDLDFLKLMNDYYYPMPEGMRALKSAEDLKAIKPFDIHTSPWGEQLKAIDILAKELEGEAYFIDTVFDPWQCLLRNLVGEHLMDLVDSDPEAVLDALDVITDNVIAYCREAIKRGAAGVFISTFSAAAQLPKNVYMKFAFPFVKRILEEIKDLAIMNTAHLHDYGIYVDECVTLPAHIISYEDTDPSNPTIPEIREKWEGSVMGGLDKNMITRVTPARAQENAETGIANGGRSKFFLAPGCSFPTWFYPPSGEIIVETAKAATRA
ncbi:MAG: uroporphyrinogen decarboxylase family protein [Alkalispirochaetaceae bacterium]